MDNPTKLARHSVHLTTRRLAMITTALWVEVKMREAINSFLLLDMMT
jgi:hypothetical protein